MYLIIILMLATYHFDRIVYVLGYIKTTHQGPKNDITVGRVHALHSADLNTPI